MRHISAVAQQLLDVIPEEKTDLRSQIESIKNDTAYKAPEQHHPYWNVLASILNKNCNPGNSEWELELSLIFAGEK